MPRPKLTDTEKLVSFTARFTNRQLARLERLSTADGLPVKEHVRRALDAYVLRHEMAAGMSQLPYDVTHGTDMRPFLPMGAQVLVATPEVQAEAAAVGEVLRSCGLPVAPLTDAVATTLIPPQVTDPMLALATSPIQSTGSTGSTTSVDALLNGLNLPEIGGDENND